MKEKLLREYNNRIKKAEERASEAERLVEEAGKNLPEDVIVVSSSEGLSGELMKSDNIVELRSSRSGKMILADMSESKDTIGEESERLEKEYWNQATIAYQDNIWTQPFSGLSQQESDLVLKILKNAFTIATTADMFDPAKIISQLISKVGVTEEQAEMIVRTERTAVSNKARELAYLKRDPDNEFRYQWHIANDNRVTECCRNIARRVGEGKSMQELKAILHDESIKFNGANWEYREFSPHINCRSRISRVVI